MYEGPVSAVKLGLDETGRLLVATSKFTANKEDALYVADALTGQVLWSKNYRTPNRSYQWGATMAFGRFGPENKITLAVGWASTYWGDIFVNLYDVAAAGQEYGVAPGTDNVRPGRNGSYWHLRSSGFVIQSGQKSGVS